MVIFNCLVLIWVFQLIVHLWHVMRLGVRVDKYSEASRGTGQEICIKRAKENKLVFMVLLAQIGGNWLVQVNEKLYKLKEALASGKGPDWVLVVQVVWSQLILKARQWLVFLMIHVLVVWSVKFQRGKMLFHCFPKLTVMSSNVSNEETRKYWHLRSWNESLDTLNYRNRCQWKQQWVILTLT